MAMLYDFCLLFALASVVVAIVLMIGVSTGYFLVDHSFSHTLPAVVVLPVIVTVWLIFYIWFWRHGGQTLGMLAWRIRLVALTGGTPSVKDCILRCLWAFPSALLCGLGYLWIYFDPQNCCLHDRLSKTRVILKNV